MTTEPTTLSRIRQFWWSDLETLELMRPVKSVERHSRLVFKFLNTVLTPMRHRQHSDKYLLENHAVIGKDTGIGQL